MSMMYRPAAPTGRKPLIGLYGLSGSGKTYSSLLLARGLVGPTGKIAMIDTESGRGSFYADVIPGGYDVLELGEPFSPARHIEAMDAAFKAGAGVLVIDSISHSWEGIGGVTDMAAAIEERSGKTGLHCWKDPKMQHTKMMLKFLQSPIPIICCLRAKRKTRQVKDERGKTVIVKDEFSTPKQEEGFISEMTVHAEIMGDHTLRVTKVSHPRLAEIFRTGDVVTVQTGEALAAWAAGRGAEPKVELTSEQRAQNWANTMIKRLDAVMDPAAVDAILAKNKAQLEEVRSVDRETAAAVEEAAELRKKFLTANPT